MNIRIIYGVLISISCDVVSSIPDFQPKRLSLSPGTIIFYYD